MRASIKSVKKAAKGLGNSNSSGFENSEENVIEQTSPEEVKSDATLPTDQDQRQATPATSKTIKLHECDTDSEDSDMLVEDMNEEMIEDSDMLVDSKFHFQLENDDWAIFTEKMECYLLTKSITEDKLKVATLATRLGDDAQTLLKQLVAPEKITTKKYEELIKAMTDQLAPTSSEAM